MYQLVLPPGFRSFSDRVFVCLICMFKSKSKVSKSCRDVSSVELVFSSLVLIIATRLGVSSSIAMQRFCFKALCDAYLKWCSFAASF